jgi:iron complex transport system ATP-binding protein
VLETAGTALAFEQASVRYGTREVVHEVSIRIPAGELLALAGPNGSGKSTLLRAGLGLIPLSSGRALLGGRPVETIPVADRARMIAWMPQEEPVGDNIPLLDYVDYGREPHRDWTRPAANDDRARVEDALRLTGLSELRERRIWELSGGERQRARLARALVQDTPTIALDEPTAHLDIGHQLELLDLVRTVAHRDGRAVVLALHDLNLAARYADRVIVLSRGRLVADGPPARVLSARLLRDVWGVVAELKHDARTGAPYLVPTLPIEPQSEALAMNPRLGPVHVVGGGGSASELLRALSDAGFELSLGVVPLFDTDLEVSEELHVPSVVEVPFAPISAPVRAQHQALLAAARTIVVAPFPVGPGNLSNVEDVCAVANQVPVVLLEPPDSPPRDFTGGGLPPLLEEIRNHGGVTVPTVRDALDVVTTRLRGPRSS